jgi:hypothetical protein
MALLAAETADAKATLKAAKVQLEETFSQHRELAEEIAKEDTRIARETEEAQTLAKEITDMQLELARLRRDHPIAQVSPKHSSLVFASNVSNNTFAARNPKSSRTNPRRPNHPSPNTRRTTPITLVPTHLHTRCPHIGPHFVRQIATRGSCKSA